MIRSQTRLSRNLVLDSISRATDHHRIMEEMEKIYMMCECGCGQRGHDLHHALISRLKRFPELNDVENLVLVNHDEHIARKFDNVEWRKFFWKKQCDFYGEEHMKTWIAGLPAKLHRSRIDFIDD
jgi:hypothetical protein